MRSLTAARFPRPHRAKLETRFGFKHCLFHNWAPGKVYSPAPLKHVDLHLVYDEAIRNCINRNLARLANHFGVSPVANRVLARARNFVYIEHDQVKKTRQKLLKPLRSAPPADLLNALYARELRVPAIISALDRLPHADQNQQATFIPSEHLETLINVSMDKSRLGTKVFQMLESSKLPTTSREKAQYLYQCWRQGQSTHLTMARGNQMHITKDPELWRTEMRRLWPDILASRDTSAFNVLLKLAFRAQCRETQDLVDYHLQKVDRFTFLTKLRAFPPSAAPDLLRAFSEQRFVVDLSIFSSFISKMLRSRHQKHVTMAEDRFERVLRASRGIKPVSRSKAELALQLKTMDRLNQILVEDSAGIQLPVYTDARLLTQMYSHYIRQNKHSEALAVAIAMAQMDEVPPRHIVYEHIRNPATPHHVLVDLFYLCCDVNILHPQFISTSMAKAWSTVIAERSQIPRDEAIKLVNRSQEPVTM